MYIFSYKKPFFNTISSYKTLQYDTLINNDNQNIYFYFLFIKSGLCIFEKKFDNNNIFINEEEYNNFKILIKIISTKLLKNNDSDLFLFNRFLFNKFKIVILLKSKTASAGIFPINSSRGFQNLLLIHLYISLINFKGDSINKINSINKYIQYDKNNYNNYSLYQFIEENKEKIKKNEFKNITNIDFLEISIYDKYFLKYCVLHFENIFKIITKREDIDLSYTKFLNLYIIDISSDTLLFDLAKIQNLLYRKYYKNNNLFKEILFHSHQLLQSYKDKYSMRFTKIDSSQRFVKFECTSTYPRLLFIIRFLPILKGIIIVHIYYQNKLSRMSNNNISINQEAKYKEVDLVFGSYLNENGGIDLKYVMPKKLTEIEKFCEEFFITTRSCDMFKLNEPQKEFKYFNYNIINIINTMPIDVVNDDQQKIFDYINENIKNKYIEEYENNKKKLKIKDKNSENKDNFSSNIKSNESVDKLFLINKNYLYKDLFKTNNDKIICSIPINERNNNYSTIKSNKNIIKILRESDISTNRNKNNNPKKEDKSIPSEVKTITLMSESKLISKDDDYSNNRMIDDFSLISEIKKKDNSRLKLLSKYYKKDNINLKKMKFQDLLNNTSNNNFISSLQNLKEKSKIIEESEPDGINKDNSNNMIIKNEGEKNGKIRNKLKLFDPKE